MGSADDNGYLRTTLVTVCMLRQNRSIPRGEIPFTQAQGTQVRKATTVTLLTRRLLTNRNPEMEFNAVSPSCRAPLSAVKGGSTGTNRSSTNQDPPQIIFPWRSGISKRSTLPFLPPYSTP